MEGYFKVKMSWVERIIIIISGLFLVTPDNLTDIIGIVILAACIIYQLFKAKRQKAITN